MIESFKIVGLGVVSAVAYGICHDNVTARFCVEYFTVAHPRIFGATESPTVLAFGWGVVATWWVGLAFGLLLAVMSRLGPRPKLTAGDLMRPLSLLLVVMAVGSLVAGLLGYFATEQGILRLASPFNEKIPAERASRFMADAAAHLSAYGTAFLGGIMLAAWAKLQRQRRARNASRPPATPS